MLLAKTFHIHALWQGRVESAPAITARVRSYLALAEGVLPNGTGWFCKPDVGPAFDIERAPEKLEAFVAENAFPDDEGRPMENMGYSFNLLSLRGDPRDEHVGAWISLSAGGNKQNCFQLFTDQFMQDETDPSLVTYQGMRTNLLAVAQAFEPDWCQAGPIELTWYLDHEAYVRPPMTLAWMIWFSPTLSALVQPPVYSDTIIEHLADGSLFMATSTETFDCANRKHLKQARAIHRQIDPLNYTVPFCGMKGRSDRVPPFPQL